MKKFIKFASLILILFIVSCAGKEYFECKNPVKTENNKILCEK